MDLHLVRLLISVSAGINVDTSHVNVETAFLEATLEEEIWLSLPKVLYKDTEARKIIVDINTLVGNVLRLRRSLNSLKQAGLNCYKDVHAMMVKNKAMQPSPLSTGILYGPGVVVLTWVDDFLIAVNTATIE